MSTSKLTKNQSYFSSSWRSLFVIGGFWPSRSTNGEGSAQLANQFIFPCTDSEGRKNVTLYIFLTMARCTVCRLYKVFFSHDKFQKHTIWRIDCTVFEHHFYWSQNYLIKHRRLTHQSGVMFSSFSGQNFLPYSTQNVSMPDSFFWPCQGL